VPQQIIPQNHLEKKQGLTKSMLQYKIN